MATALTEFYGDIMLYVPGCPKPLVDRYLLSAVRDFCSYTGVWKTMLSPIDTIVVEEASDIAFVSGSPCTITSVTTDFSTSGLVAGDIILTNHNSSDDDEKSNTGPFTIATAGVAAHVLTLESTDRLATVSAGDAITISKMEYALTSSLGDICKILEAKFMGNSIAAKTDDELDITVPGWRTQLSASPYGFIVDMARKYIRLVPAPYEAVNNGLEVWAVLKPLTTATTIQDFLYNEYKETISHGTIARICLVPGQQWSNPQQAQISNLFYIQGRNKAWKEANRGLTKANFQLRA